MVLTPGERPREYGGEISMNNNIYFPFLLDLQLFAEAADSSGNVGAEGAGAESAEAAVQAETQGEAGETHDADAAAAEGAAEKNRTEEYRKFKKDYKQEFDSEVQSILKKRLKKASAFEGKMNAVLGMLADKYGGDPADLDSVIRSLEEDDSFFEKAAAEKGLSVAQYKEFRKMERENKAFREAAEEKKRQEQADAIYAEWQRQGEKTRAIYKNFSMENEIRNPDFVKLIRLGVDVQTAYEVVHKDEIIPAAMQLASQKTAEKISNAVAANKFRPSENGLSASSSALTALDPSRLTKMQMDEYKKRAARGEKITFRDNQF